MKDKLVHGVAKDNKAIGLELSLKEAQDLIYAENFAHSIRVVKAPQKKDLREEKRGTDQQQSSQNQTPDGVNQGQSTEGTAGN